MKKSEKWVGARVGRLSATKPLKIVFHFSLCLSISLSILSMNASESTSHMAMMMMMMRSIVCAKLKSYFYIMLNMNVENIMTCFDGIVYLYQTTQSPKILCYQVEMNERRSNMTHQTKKEYWEWSPLFLKRLYTLCTLHIYSKLTYHVFQLRRVSVWNREQLLISCVFIGNVWHKQWMICVIHTNVARGLLRLLLMYPRHQIWLFSINFVLYPFRFSL